MKLIEIMEKYDLFGFWRAGPNGKMVESIYTDKGYVHSYVQNFYEEEFKKYQDQAIDFLEIGIGSGGSCFLWKEYFRKATRIVVVDRTDECLHPDLKGLDGVTMVFEDAYDRKLADSLGNFDIIIDDGPHTLESQLQCIEYYLPHLKAGGVLVIEDVQKDSYFEKYIEVTRSVYEMDESSDFFEFECLDFRQSSDRKSGFTPPSDDMMYIVRKT